MGGSALSLKSPNAFAQTQPRVFTNAQAKPPLCETKLAPKRHERNTKSNTTPDPERIASPVLRWLGRHASRGRQQAATDSPRAVAAAGLLLSRSGKTQLRSPFEPEGSIKAGSATGLALADPFCGASNRGGSGWWVRSRLNFSGSEANAPAGSGRGAYSTGRTTEPEGARWLRGWAA
jgi:hypothetical protein